MKREDVIRMAREAGFGGDAAAFGSIPEFLERFAALVAAAEREACAKWYKEEGWLLDEEDAPDSIRVRAKS